MSPAVGPYSPVRRVGDWVITSGQVGLATDGTGTAASGRGRDRGRTPAGAAERGRGARRRGGDAVRRRQDDGLPPRHVRVRRRERGLGRVLHREPARRARPSPWRRSRSAPGSRSRPGPTRRWSEPTGPPPAPPPAPERSVALRHAGVPGHLPEAVADRADGLDQVGVLLAELGPQAPDVDVDRAGAAVVLVAPDPAEQGLAGEDLGRVPGQEAQELVFHVGQVEDPARHGGLVRLEVEHQRPVLDDVGPHALAGAPEEVLQARHQLVGPGGQDAEVVVEVVAQQQLAHLVGADGEEQRGHGHLAQAEVAAEGDGGGHVVTRDDQRARVARRAAVGAGRRHLVGPRHALVAEARVLQREGHLGGQVGGEAEEGVHRSVRLRGGAGSGPARTGSPGPGRRPTPRACCG